MAKKIKTLGIVFMALAAVGLLLAIIGMCTGIVSDESESIGLFHETWKTLESIPQASLDAMAKAGYTVPSRTFTLLAFVVTLIGAVVVLVHGILAMTGKNIKVLGIIGGAVTIVGGVLILVAGLVLAGQFNKFGELSGGYKVSAGIGIWLGAIGGVLAGVMGLLNALKVGQKAEA